MGRGALRNEACHCGSGHKYADCCFDVDTIRKELEKKGRYSDTGLGLGRPMISRIFQGKRVVAVGSRLYTDIKPESPFHEFAIGHLQNILGKEWIEAERIKPESEKHQIVKWFDAYARDRQHLPMVLENPKTGLKSMPTSGDVISLLSLAYDIYCVEHCAQLRPKLLTRLKNYQEFQGVKYEIAVAATFMRAGFLIAWMPEKRIESIHECEFLAFNVLTKEFVVVEAKSRRRRGIFHETTTESAIFQMAKADVLHLYQDAVIKNKHGLPLVVFIDVNLQPEPNPNPTLVTNWAKALVSIFSDGPVRYEEHSLLMVTNYSWHYLGSRYASLWAEKICIIPHQCKVPIQNHQTIQALMESVKVYGAVPPLFPDQH